MESDDQEYVEAGTGVMVSNLPLLFARGRPSSLHYMSLAELEVFVPFMVRCSVGEDRPVPWSQLPRPSWWPRKLPFRMPSASSTSATRTALIDLVERCYNYHGCEYLLQFCDSLQMQMPSSGYRFNDNRDGTTSMYHGCTGKLLVTFRNENREYDKYSHDGRSSQKKLLLSPSAHTDRRGSNGTAMFQPPVSDIYLCDKCENEFYSLREVQSHERQCRGDAQSSPHVPSPEPDPLDDEPEPAGQVPFLAYFSLQPAEHTGIKPYTSPRKRSAPSPPRKSFGPTYHRYDSIALSSPLGKFVLGKAKFRNKIQATQHLVMKYERNLRTSANMEVPSVRERCFNRWIVVWKAQKEAQPWIHKYCFSRHQKREQKITIKTGLNKRSRKLLRKCRPCSVKVKRLQKRLVDRLKRLGGPSAPCIDLTDETQNLPLHNFSILGQYINNTFGKPHSEHLTLLHSPERKINLGASSSFVNTSSNSWASTSHNLTGIYSVQGEGAALQREAANIQIANSSASYFVHDQQGSVEVSALPYERRLKQEHEKPGFSPSKFGSHSQQHHKNLNSVNANLPLNISEPMNSPVIKNNGLFKTSREQSFISRSEAKVKNETKVGVVPPRYSSNSSLAVAETEEMPNSWQSVPHTFESVNSFLVGSAGVSVSRTNSSIEIIDLSSDDDENVKSRNQNEADNAPQQLDGFHCYPHSGAKIPFSSKHSLPKNGNSHWSSNQKSHCGAGHIGDLATNGQSPNVPTNVPISPVPDSMFLPTVQVCKTLSTLGSKNSRNWKKGKHSMERKVLNSDDPSRDLNHPSKFLEQNSKLRSGTPKGLNFADTFTDVLSRECSSSSSEDTVDQDSDRFIIDSEISFKPPLHVDEDISFNVSQKSLHLEGNEKCRESASGLEDLSKGKQGQTVEAPVVGFISNIVNTVNKGVEFFKALVGGSASDIMNVKDTPTKEQCFTILPAKEELQQIANQLKKNLPEKGLDKKNRNRKRKREMDKLLQDECRELKDRGLGELMHGIHETRMTRRSVERFIPSRRSRTDSTRRKHHVRRHSDMHFKAADKYSLKREKSLIVKDDSTIPKVESDMKVTKAQCVFEASITATPNISMPYNVSPLIDINMCDEYIDENGNSPSYSDISSVFDGERSNVVDCNLSDGLISPIGLENVAATNNNCEGTDLIFHKANQEGFGHETSVQKENSWNLKGKGASNWKTSSEASRHRGTRELLNLVNDEWKEMQKKGFHPMKIVKPALLKKVRLEQKENKEVKPMKASALKGTHSPLQDGRKDSIQVNCHPSDLFAGTKVEIPLAKTHMTSDCMAETAEEHGALLAEIPCPDRCESIPSNFTPCRSSCKPLVFAMRETYTDLMSNDSSINVDCNSENPDERARKVRRKRSLPRELFNLAGDEWKEMRGKGFHPSDLLGTQNGKVEYLDFSVDAECIQESKPRQSMQKSITTEESVPKKTKLSRELVCLLKDECKELQPLNIRRHRLKPHSRRTLQPFGLKRLQEAYSSADLKTRKRSTFQNAHIGSLNLAGKGCTLTGTKSQLSRNTRSQTNMLSNVEAFTPRSSHREILQSELAMCVLNYHLPTIL